MSGLGRGVQWCCPAKGNRKGKGNTMSVTVKVLATQFITHDVKQFTLERPAGYSFIPGQATEVSINRPGMEAEKRPFTFTSLNEDLVLTFTIKGYFDHDGVTKKLHALRPGDEVILQDVWGAIQYKGPGVFLAGGAGVTPFIAILRRLRLDGHLADNTLMFSNKTARDVILEQEFKEMLGDRLILTLTRDAARGYLHQRIDRRFLKRHVKDFSRHFYVCGPRPFVNDLTATLRDLGAPSDGIVIEE
jgi:ferredoxin-NADP reductase